MRKESLSLINEINEVKEEICQEANRSLDDTHDQEQIDEKVHRLKKDFDILEEKCENMIRKMCSLDE